MSHTTAKVIADTMGNAGARITTFEIYAPRFLLAEINTHGVLSKSAASSRAIPVEKRINMVRDQPFIPEAFTKNKKGMSADEVLSDEKNDRARAVWITACDMMAVQAMELAALDTHKQHANRLLESFTYVHGVITATEWDNFYKLRMSKAAQPEFQELAMLMNAAHGWSKPKLSMYHLPYTDTCDPKLDIDTLFKISTARCARVSYKTFDGTPSTAEADIALCERLITEGHMSPFAHPAVADNVGYDNDTLAWWWDNPELHKQYWGWIPHRVVMEETLGIVSRRDSFAPLTMENAHGRH